MAAWAGGVLRNQTLESFEHMFQGSRSSGFLTSGLALRIGRLSTNTISRCQFVLPLCLILRLVCFETSAQNGCPLLGNTKIFVLILLPLDLSVAIEHEYAVPFQELNRRLLEQSAVVLSGCFFKDSGE